MNVVISRGLIALSLFCASCTTTKESNPDVLSAKQAGEVDRLIRQVPFKTGADRMNTLRQISAYGTYAIDPVSKQMITNPDDAVRANGIFVLGLIFEQDRDVRALELIRDGSKDPDLRVRLESARVLLEGGDRVGVPDLLAALGDKSEWVRSVAYEALHKSAKQSFGYDPKGDEASRAAAIERFRDYYANIDTTKDG